MGLLEKASNAYQRGIQNFSHWLYRKGWPISSMIVASLLGEPLESTKSLIRRIFGWKASWEGYGFFDAGDPKSLERLREAVGKTENASQKLFPVLCLHGLFATPDVFLPWAPTLQKASQEKKIGKVISLQLDNDLGKRMVQVYRAIKEIIKIYKEVHGDTQIDIIGHSFGGYAAHLAAFKKEHIQIRDADGILRGWHSLNPEHRNPEVRKVISVAAPTWLCCEGQVDETTPSPPYPDIYPLKVFIEKNLDGYTKKQLEEIRKKGLLEGINDIVATQDAISATVSPLPEHQVHLVKKRHLGAITDTTVCELAIEILTKLNNSKETNISDNPISFTANRYYF